MNKRNFNLAAARPHCPQSYRVVGNRQLSLGPCSVMTKEGFWYRNPWARHLYRQYKGFRVQGPMRADLQYPMPLGSFAPASLRRLRARVVFAQLRAKTRFGEPDYRQALESLKREWSRYVQAKRAARKAALRA